MTKILNAVQQRWVFLLACSVIAGCTFDTAGELSTACLTNDDCTQGRVCSAQFCQNPGDLNDASEDFDGLDGTPDGSLGDVPTNDGQDANPGDGGVDPGDAVANPDDGGVNPGDGDANPGDGDANPGDGDVDPGDGGVNPGDVDVESDTNPVEPVCDIILTDRTAVEACQDTIVFVSGLRGAAGNEGTMMSPLKTIGEGLSKAASMPQISWVLVESGEYPEQIQLVNGVGIVGGYDNGWNRVANQRSVIISNSLTLSGQNIDEPTLIAYLDIRVRDVVTDDINAGAVAKSIVTVMLKDSSGVILKGVDIRGGKAGAGRNGVVGTLVAAGADGGGSWGAVKPAGESVTCADGKKSGAGGEGGDNKDNGEKGKDGAGGGGTGGARGTKGVNGAMNGAVGGGGGAGKAGVVGFGGPGDGRFVGINWQGKPGGAGLYGLSGGGGGGGGGGHCTVACPGGGGGSGGCGGSGGDGGFGGGASVVLMLVGSDIAIHDGRLEGGQGGDGGEGVSGGGGGGGGKGKEFTGIGGDGGNGGAGGQGGQGGGGAGGPSFVIVSDQPFNNVHNSEIVTGTGGEGGVGGNAGVDGVSQERLVQPTGL